MRLTRAASYAALACLLAATRGALAQDGAPAASDAMVIVAPAGPRATVAITFGGPRPHAAVRSLLASMAAAGGWRLERVEVRDETAVASTGAGAQRRLGTQTVATATVVGPPQVSGGGVILQPYVQLLTAVRRAEVLFLVPAVDGLRPLESYEGEGVVVRLLRAGGPYHYVLERQEGGGRLPNLPLTQQETRPADNVSASARLMAADWRVAAAVLSGLVAAALVFMLCRGAGRRSGRHRPIRRIQ